MPGVQKNRADMITDIVSNIYNNIIKFITGDNVQQRLLNLESSVPNILSDKDAANGYVGLDANGQMLQAYVSQTVTKAFMDTLVAANQVVPNKVYRISNAATTRSLIVRGATTSTLYAYATDTTTGESGIYTLSTDKFVTGNIIPFKKSLSAANLLAGGDFDITELPAPGAGYAWKVIDSELKYTFNSVAYDNLDISVQSETGRSQFSILAAETSAYSGNHFGNLVMQNPIDDGDQTIVKENEKMIVQLSTSTVGNGTAIVYGAARLITL